MSFALGGESDFADFYPLLMHVVVPSA